MEKEDEALHYLLIPLYLIFLAEQLFRGKTRLQKMVFLTQKRTKDLFNFEFEPAPLGPLSHQLNHFLERMIKMGLLKEEIGKTPSGNEVISYRITNSGRKMLDFGLKSGYMNENIREAVESISSEYRDTSYVELLDYVHETYPEYRL